MTLFDDQDVGTTPSSAPSAPPASPSTSPSPPVPASSDSTVRVRMTVAYDGSGFHGFAASPGVRTVAGTLTEAIETVLGTRIELVCAGRTDAGVHAWGQVVSFDAPARPRPRPRPNPHTAPAPPGLPHQDAAGFDPVALQRSLNRMCAPAIVVRDAAPGPDGFDARFSAAARTYRYSVLNRSVPDPFLAHLSWHVDRPLDLDLLRLACDPLIGEHDFSAFCRRPKRLGRRQGSAAGRGDHGVEGGGRAGVSLVREVRRAGWDDLGNGLLRFEITANAFCHQMVRSIVGTLVEVGLGKISPGEVTGILAGRDRAAAGSVAPPHGLCLWHVDYPDTEVAGANG